MSHKHATKITLYSWENMSKFHIHSDWDGFDDNEHLLIGQNLELFQHRFQKSAERK